MVTTERRLPDTYYDDTDLEDLYHIPVVFKNPTWAQKKEIDLYKTLYRGVMLVSGKARSGKDLFGVTFSYLNKLYFGRPILLDFKPKRLFGDYTPFDPTVMIKEINKMAKQSKFVSDNPKVEMSKAEADYFTNYADEWLNTKGEVLFKGAILYLSELRRYVYNRNPMSRMNKSIGSLCGIYGHLDLLILGTYIDYREIDFKNYLNHVTTWAHCDWSTTRFNNTEVIIRRGANMSEMGRFNYAMQPFRYWVNGAENHKFLLKPDTICSISKLGRLVLEKKKVESPELLSILQYLSVENLSVESQTVLAIANYFCQPMDNFLWQLAEMQLINGLRFYDLYVTTNAVNLKPVLPKEMSYA